MPPWLSVALALHAALLALGSFRGPGKTAPPSISRAPGLLWLDTASAVAINGTEPAREPRPDAASEAAGSAGAATAPTASVAPPASLPRAFARSALPGAEGASAGDVGEVAAAPEPGATPESGSPNADGPGPQLSLGQLGIGRENNPFLEPRALPPSAQRAASQRLQSSLKNELARHDQRLGLGPEGPAVAAVKALVLASPTVNTSATLRFRTDAAGLTVAVEVLDASSANDEWQRIAEQLWRALADKKLRILTQSGGVSMDLRVVSRVQLPSGADPGFAIELFGQTLKEGGGDKSARLSLLTPKVTIAEVEVPYTDGQHTMLVPTLSLGGLSGDIGDVGRVAQRIVTAYLVAMETHPAEFKPPSPSAP